MAHQYRDPWEGKKGLDVKPEGYSNTLSAAERWKIIHNECQSSTTKYYKYTRVLHRLYFDVFGESHILTCSRCTTQMYNNLNKFFTNKSKTMNCKYRISKKYKDRVFIVKIGGVPNKVTNANLNDTFAEALLNNPLLKKDIIEQNPDYDGTSESGKVEPVIIPPKKTIGFNETPETGEDDKAKKEEALAKILELINEGVELLNNDNQEDAEKKFDEAEEVGEANKVTPSEDVIQKIQDAYNAFNTRKQNEEELDSEIGEGEDTDETTETVTEPVVESTTTNTEKKSGNRGRGNRNK